ncbi:hypothetical protein [Cytophaga sp. FL35]|uniref:hypothetical protein n=1 Tax=Cytophaga sp. FL35 TaxID=1904456 RepID=UPI001653ADAC|nr:hypothetical protein [Cytophaga sp. FL35]MBC6999731.1 hypothetical protein [Cytophaga sp. FL35]
MPRLALYYVENHRIEIVKTLLGKEQVLLNGMKISEAKWEHATKHYFSVNRNKYRIGRRDSSKADKMNTYEIHKDGAPVALINVEQQSSSFIIVLIILVGVGCGYLFGAFVYQLFFSNAIA